MIPDTTIIAIRWLTQPALGDRPARTLLVGAATLGVRYRFGSLAFDLQANASTVTDDPAQTIAWLAERLSSPPSRLLLWRPEDIVVPCLISVAETARDTMAATRMLRSLERAFSGEVIDVADAYGGAKGAPSFDAIAHRHHIEALDLTNAALEQAHRTGCHGDISEHLASRAKALWQLWLREQEVADALRSMTSTWLESPDAGRPL